MKRKKTIDFLLVTLFSAILLTFTVIIGLGNSTSSAEDGTRTFSFNRKFYSDSTITDFVKYIDYKVFGHIDDNDILVGKDDWLFEVTDSKNGYERLLDYIGENSFTEEELERIANVIARRASDYEKEGIDYMLIVVPDSMTVCSDNVPWYLGDQSENTRLAQLTSCVEQKGIGAFVNPTDIMKAESRELVMYNNTENSINAYGAYCIYNTAITKLLADTGKEVDRIHRDDIEFFTRITDGRYTAQRAGLARTIKNRTISISDGMTDGYEVVYRDRDLVTTERMGAHIESSRECVVVEYTDNWDGIQLMPYFSNTFEKVHYREKLMTHPNVSVNDGATLVIQIIHESELDILLK